MKKKLINIIDKNKTLWALFCIIISLMILIGSTYAWITDNDERINRARSSDKDISARIVEVFDPDSEWEPSIETKKEITIYNDGSDAELVRVSLYEFLLNFEVDTTDIDGNGNIVITDSPTADTIDKSDIATWEVGNTYMISSGKYYIASDSIISDSEDGSTAYKYQTNRSGALKYITLNFADANIYTSVQSGLSDYWLYEDGYFYYSEVLNPGDSTNILLESFTLSGKVPNKYKASLYQLLPVADAHDTVNEILSNWNVNSGTQAYTLLSDKIN